MIPCILKSYIDGISGDLNSNLPGDTMKRTERTMGSQKIITIFRFFFTVFLLTVAVSCTKPASAARISDPSLFSVKPDTSDELPSYGCIRLRRGDSIELTGTVSRVRKGTQIMILLTTAANRVFILQSGAASLTPGTTYRTRSVITFEGNSERLPELAVHSFKRIKTP